MNVAMLNSPLLQGLGQGQNQGFDPNNPLSQNNLSGAQNIAQQAQQSSQPSAAASMSPQQKMMIAQALMQMGQQGARQPPMPQLMRPQMGM